MIWASIPFQSIPNCILFWTAAKFFVILHLLSTKSSINTQTSIYKQNITMKKILFSCILCFTFLLCAQAQVVITEIMYNPPESGTDSLEFIEILNNTNATVNMAGWSLEFGTGPTVFPIPDQNLGAGQYLLFSVNAGAIQRNFGKASVQWTASGLNNNGAPIRIKNGAAAIVDEVVYDDVAPWPTTPDGGGSSLVLCDPNSDNSVATNWVSAPTDAGFSIANIPVFANPGAASGCLTGLVALPDVAFVVPDKPINIDVVNNDNVPGGAATTLTVVTAPAHGTATVSSDTSILYTPSPGYCGPDVLTYRVCTSPNTCATATVTITVKCYPVRTIDQVNNVNLSSGVADSVNVSCELTGIVYGVNLRASVNGLQFALVNPAGTEGISTFRGLGNFGYNVQEGDRITVRGTIAQFSGLTQINMDTIIKVNSGNALVTPPVVLRVDESTESRLVQIKNLRYVDIAQWLPGVGPGFTVRLYSTSNPTDTIAMRIDNDVDLYNQPTPPSEPFHVTGIGGQFDGSSPFTTGYQLLPRYIPDINTMVGTTLVDYSASVTLSPNPVHDMMTIQTTVAFDRISVFGTDGKLMRTIQNPNSTELIDLAGMPAGVYAVRFEKLDTIWTKAVIKN